MGGRGEKLPEGIFAHGWLLLDQEKMSKSKGNVAYAEPVARTLGVDALRYYLLREVSFGQDGNFSHEALVQRYNSDLANGLGNLASRTLAMIERYCDGVVPSANAGSIEAEETQLVADVKDALANALREYEALSFARALEIIWAAVAAVDGYLTLRKPWTLADDPAQRKRLETVLNHAAESLRVIVALAHPALPQATAKIWRQLGQSGQLAELRIDQLAWGQLPAGTRIGELSGVFPRIERKEALERMANMEQEMLQPGAKTAAAGAAGTLRPVPEGWDRTPSSICASSRLARRLQLCARRADFGIDDFAKGGNACRPCENRLNALRALDKLMKLMVDIGDEVRQIVAGIATAYTPEQLVGRKVVAVVNLAPRKLRGVESNGMIVAATDADGKPVLASFLEEAPVGARLK